jgi:hypothetical protein
LTLARRQDDGRRRDKAGGRGFGLAHITYFLGDVLHAAQLNVVGQAGWQSAQGLPDPSRIGHGDVIGSVKVGHQMGFP